MMELDEGKLRLLAALSAGLGTVGLLAVFMLVAILISLRQQMKDVSSQVVDLAQAKKATDGRLETLRSEVARMLQSVQQLEHSRSAHLQSHIETASLVPTAVKQGIVACETHPSLVLTDAGRLAHDALPGFEAQPVMVNQQPDAIFIRGVTPLMQSLGGY